MTTPKSKGPPYMFHFKKEAAYYPPEKFITWCGIKVTEERVTEDRDKVQCKNCLKNMPSNLVVPESPDNSNVVTCSEEFPHNSDDEITGA